MKQRILLLTANDQVKELEVKVEILELIHANISSVVVEKAQQLKAINKKFNQEFSQLQDFGIFNS